MTGKNILLSFGKQIRRYTANENVLGNLLLVFSLVFFATVWHP